MKVGGGGRGRPAFLTTKVTKGRQGRSRAAELASLRALGVLGGEFLPRSASGFVASSFGRRGLSGGAGAPAGARDLVEPLSCRVKARSFAGLRLPSPDRG